MEKKIIIRNNSSMRKVVDRHESNNGLQVYTIVVDAKKIPTFGLGDWLEINPREANLKSGISKRIENSLRDNPDDFLIKNRGITMLVKSIDLDQKTESIHILLSDEKKHGILDGGHTYAVIEDFFSGNDKNKEEENSNAKVLFQIIELPDNPESKEMQELLVKIVEARNTSIQVRDESLLNLANVFNPIKSILKSKRYSDRIAYNENETNDEGGRKDISIKDILSYIKCFDRESFDADRHPIHAYSTKSLFIKELNKTGKDGESARGDLARYLLLLPKILELHDQIYLDLPDAYNKSNDGGNSRKFGLLQGIQKKEKNDGRAKKIDLAFTDKESEYLIPSGFIYPILAAFRALVRVDNKDVRWLKDPVEVWSKLKVRLASDVGGSARELKNPNKLGKHTTTWRLCYGTVERYVLENRLE